MDATRAQGGATHLVGNQMVGTTLMTLADNPTNVQLPGQYQVEEIHFPVIAAGNDFSTLYAAHPRRPHGEVLLVPHL